MKTHQVVVNGLTETVPGGLTVEGLICHFQEGDTDLIVEINGRYVYPRDYETVRIKAFDVIEFINPNLGG
ncbi:MAG: MoaD/ThiS family protein [Pseudomonadota bacterium]